MSSSTATNLSKTALHGLHVALGGAMVDFGGWEMPLWYSTGAIKEHLAVLNGAGLFDTGHMTVVLAEGPQLRDFLNFAVTRDISDLAPGRAAYGLILDSQGQAVDDCLVYPFTEERFALVVNAGMGPTVIAHMKTLPGADRVKWLDLAGRLAKLDLQGPASFKIFKDLVADAGEVFAKFPYFSFKGDFELEASSVRLADGAPVLLSRTGYTGELGFEIFLAPERAEAVWRKILEAGRDYGLLPCGLAARDSLRAGAVLPLSHQDIGRWPFINNPWPWALPLDAKGAFTKKFMGSDALDPETADHTLAFVGFDPRKVEVHEAKVIYEDQEIGLALTAVADMGIGRVDGRVVGLASPDKPEGFAPKGLVCGFVKVNRRLEPGAIIYLKDARRQLKAEICADIRPGRTARRPLAA
ncbi:MAG: aminomethyl transferase family protein [Candidatus Adiutrix sp.]|jgi:aminomethyltransferase|nr:aminomethyl transferase family protein [Candidatus Adiutrix sp.]